jgi:hypothetical protein
VISIIINIIAAAIAIIIAMLFGSTPFASSAGPSSMDVVGNWVIFRVYNPITEEAATLSKQSMSDKRFVKPKLRSVFLLKFHLLLLGDLE